MTKFHVSVDWCSNAGNPLTKTSMVEAKTSSEALDILTERVRKFKRCMKINGGTASPPAGYREQEEPEDKPVGIFDIQLCIDAKTNRESLEQNGCPAVGADCLVTESLITKLYDNELWSYEDKSVQLKEHLFGLSLYDDLLEAGIPLSRNEDDSLSAIYKEMEKKDCSYFRFIS